MLVDVKLVHPELMRRLQPVFDAMTAFGHSMRIVQGARTAEYQHGLWRQGREIPGAIVTNADGYIKLSPHQIRADGFGHAVDAAFVVDPFGEKQPWVVFGKMVEYVGLKWGGNFTSLVDRPHVELM